MDEKNIDQAIAETLEALSRPRAIEKRHIPNFDAVEELFKEASESGTLPAPRKLADSLFLAQRVALGDYLATKGDDAGLSRPEARALAGLYMNAEGVCRYLARVVAELEGGACSVDKARAIMDAMVRSTLDPDILAELSEKDFWTLPRKGTLPQWVGLAEVFQRVQSTYQWQEIVATEEQLRALYRALECGDQRDTNGEQ